MERSGREFFSSLLLFEAWGLIRGFAERLGDRDTWQRVIPGPGLEPLQRPGCFQNGAYWATASGWYAELLESLRPGSGLAFLIELVREFQTHGIWECIGPDDYARLENNLSSMMLPYRAFKAILSGGALGK